MAKRERFAYSRDERKAMVMVTLAVKAQHGQMPESTMYGLARSLKMRPSTKLLSMLWEMVAADLLETRAVKHRKGWWKTIFALKAGTYVMAKPRTASRTIKVNGQQMEMF